MRSVFFWEAAGLSLDRANPYGALLARSMADLGIEMVAGHTHDFNESWLRANQGSVDVLHLNWPHYMYDAPELAGRVAGAEKLVSNLTLAKTLGFRIVWTVHNLYPHESANYELDRLVRLAITQLADAIIVHCEYAREQISRHFYRTDGLFVIPHGHFIDAYPNHADRDEARQRLGIDDDEFVYFFFGNVRRYKGLEQLLETFQSLLGDHLRLLVAAKVYNDYGEHFVEHAAQVDPRVMLHSSRFFANEEFQWLFNSGDVGVFPFVDVLTSGSVVTALSFGLPVIAPAAGCLPELIPADAGIVYDPAEDDGLKRAMLAAQSREMASMSAAALSRARVLDWTQIARQTRQAYGRIPV